MNRMIYKSGLAMLLAGVSMPALAQSEAPSGEGGLDQIVVTAERREQNLQDVPIAATVLMRSAQTGLHPSRPA